MTLPKERLNQPKNPRRSTPCWPLGIGFNSVTHKAGVKVSAKKPENKGKTIVALLPDTGDRYLSTPLFAD